MKLFKRAVDAVASPAPDPETGDDRRDHARILTVYRVARLNIDSDAGLCRVQNISDSGMMLVTGLDVAKGDSVVIALSDRVVIPGEVAWTDGARVGVHFAEPVDAAAVLQSLTDKPTGERPFRLPVDTVAVAFTSSGTRPVRVVDISQQGMKVSHDGGFTLGMQVKIQLPNGIARRGIVRWANENMAGLRLIEPIGFHELESASRL